jgi:uncharacterized protein YjbJ (UPF0337 family)
MVIDNDMPEDRWKQVCAQARIWWDKLTDDDLDKIGGKAERMADVLQNRYGYVRQYAESQSNHWMQQHREKPTQPRAGKR